MPSGRFPLPGHNADGVPYRRLNYAFAYVWQEGPPDLERLLAHLGALHAADPHHHYLCTLDDPGQCSYTSGHACEDDRFDLDEPDDMDWDNPVQLAAWELASLQHRVQQLGNPDVAQTWADVCGTLSASADSVDALLTANRAPDQLIDEVVYIQRLPVAAADLMIAGQPNGYFGTDWDTFQNHAIIRHLATQWGYRFFGMGASWMGFVRTTPPDADQAQRLVADLRDLYGAGQGDEVLQHAGWQALAQLLATQRTLVLGYTENMDVWADGGEA